MKKTFKMMAIMVVMGGMVFASYGKDDEDNSGTGEGTASSYVHLALSSGTKWKNANETNDADAEYDFFTYDEAMAQFGSKIPSNEQWMELVNECNWSWTGMGYKVTGSNGNFINLPAWGSRDCDSNVWYVGTRADICRLHLMAQTAHGISSSVPTVRTCTAALAATAAPSGSSKIDDCARKSAINLARTLPTAYMTQKNNSAAEQSLDCSAVFLFILKIFCIFAKCFKYGENR